MYLGFITMYIYIYHVNHAGPHIINILLDIRLDFP